LVCWTIFKIFKFFLFSRIFKPPKTHAARISERTVTVAVFGLESWLFVVGVQAVDLGQHRQQSSHWHSHPQVQQVCGEQCQRPMVSPSEGIQNHRKATEIRETSSRILQSKDEAVTSTGSLVITINQYLLNFTLGHFLFWEPGGP